MTWQVPRSGRVRRATPRESARAATTGARPMHEAPVVSALRNSSRSRRRPGRTGGAGARRSDAALTIAARPCGCIPLYPRCGCSVFGLGIRFLYCSGPRGGRSGSAIRRWRRAAAAAARAWTWRFPLPGFELRYRRGARRSDRPGVRDRFPALILHFAPPGRKCARFRGSAWIVAQITAVSTHEHTLRCPPHHERTGPTPRACVPAQGTAWNSTTVQCTYPYPWHNVTHACLVAS